MQALAPRVAPSNLNNKNQYLLVSNNEAAVIDVFEAHKEVGKILDSRDVNLKYLLITLVFLAAAWGVLLAGRLVGLLGIRPMAVAGVGMLLFMFCQAVIMMGWHLPPLLLWVVFGFSGTSGILVYADLSQRFPADLAGRVNTGLNLLVFIAAFCAQWGVGAVIDQWPNTLTGYAPEGYRAGFGLLLVLQTLAVLWFAVLRWKMGEDTGSYRFRRGRSRPSVMDGCR